MVLRTSSAADLLLFDKLKSKAHKPCTETKGLNPVPLNCSNISLKSILFSSSSVGKSNLGKIISL